MYESTMRPFLSVPVHYGESVRKELIAKDLLDFAFKIVVEAGRLYFPLHTLISAEEVHRVFGSMDVTTGSRTFEEVEEEPHSIHELLSDVLSEADLALLPRSYDLIGDIAVLEVPDELEVHRQTIGEAFLTVHKSFSTVLAKKGAIAGTTRIRDYELLAGVDKTKTVHIEYGCKISVDLAKAYFSPRLLEEHHQVAQQVVTGETVIDMFTGVGPFALHITKETDCRVIAIDINEGAIGLLRESMALNRLVGLIEPVHADARDYVHKNQIQDADRIIMNHPSAASEFISDACYAIKPGGIIHYYDFVGGSNPENIIKESVTHLVEATGRKVKEVLRIRQVRDSAPYEYQMVIDLVVI